jgi:hypothetical protein
MAKSHFNGRHVRKVRNVNGGFIDDGLVDLKR